MQGTQSLCSPPDVGSVRENRRHLGEAIWETPAVLCPERALRGAASQLWLKLEAFQVTGSFKARSALTVIRHLDAEQRKRGLVTFSSGNHAIALAFGAQCYGCSALIYMAANADEYRVAKARAMGADVRLVQDNVAAFEEVKRSVKEDGRYFVHPFEGPWTTLGTASIATEVDSQLPTDVDLFVVAIGGGSLASGLAPIIKALRPGARVVGIEPEGAPTLTHSLALGAPATLTKVATIADSLAPPFAEPYSFSLVRDYVNEILLVDDNQIRQAMRLLFEHLKLVIEPAGATALAGVLAFPDLVRDRKVCAMVCGSNIGTTRYSQVLGGAGS